MMEKQQVETHSIQVSDIIQMCCLNMLSGVFQITDEGFSGSVYLRKGAVVHALADGIQGEAAFYSILRHWYADIEFKEGPHDAPQTITAAWEHLIMESTRRQDHAVFEEGVAVAGRSTGSSLIRILVKRIAVPRHLQQDQAKERSRRADFSGLIRKKDSMTEECIVDTLSDEGASIRTLGSFAVGERAQLTFKIPPRQEEVSVTVEVTKVSLDTISVEALFVNPSDHVRRLIGFFLWNA